MTNRQKPKKVTIYCQTDEDWCPNYEVRPGPYSDAVAEVVAVSYHETTPSGSALVCVWGGDDCGMELFTTPAEALGIFWAIAQMANVTRERLRNLGLRST